MTKGLVILIAISLVLFALLIALYVFAFIRRSPRKRARFLEQIGVVLGVPFMKASPIYPKIPFLRLLKRPASVEGEYRGKLTKVYYAYKGAGQSKFSVYVTLERESYNPHDLRFILKRRGVASQLLRKLGLASMTFQDELFESFFSLKTNDVSLIKTLMRYQVRMDLYDYFKKNKVRGVLYLKGDAMIYEEPISLAKSANYQRLKDMADIMCCLEEGITVYHRG